MPDCDHHLSLGLTRLAALSFLLLLVLTGLVIGEGLRRAVVSFHREPARRSSVAIVAVVPALLVAYWYAAVARPFVEISSSRDGITWTPLWGESQRVPWREVAQVTYEPGCSRAGGRRVILVFTSGERYRSACMGGQAGAELLRRLQECRARFVADHDRRRPPGETA